MYVVCSKPNGFSWRPNFFLGEDGKTMTRDFKKALWISELEQAFNLLEESDNVMYEVVMGIDVVRQKPRKIFWRKIK